MCPLSDQKDFEICNNIREKRCATQFLWTRGHTVCAPYSSWVCILQVAPIGFRVSVGVPVLEEIGGVRLAGTTVGLGIPEIRPVQVKIEVAVRFRR